VATTDRGGPLHAGAAVIPAATTAATSAPAWSARRMETYFLAVKIDLGIMQCTPFRTSTTWLTRQSPTIDTSE